MIEIPLTQGQVAFIDDEDFELVSRYKWYAQWHPRTKSFYAYSRIVNADREWSTILMHRLILNAQPGELVDHIFHDTLDNRKSELRLCTGSQNQHNAGKREDNTSGYKGVGFRSDRNLWRSRIVVNGKRIFLGNFGSPEEAHQAYCKAAAELHGEFARVA